MCHLTLMNMQLTKKFEKLHIIIEIHTYVEHTARKLILMNHTMIKLYRSSDTQMSK